MSLAFLDPSLRPGAGRWVPVARSPMEGKAVAAGATLERRDDWNVAVRFDAPQGTVGYADVSHLRKTEIQGDDVGTPDGTATRVDGAWRCVLTPTRALVVGGSAEGLYVTGAFCAMTIGGPMARETIARFCALDLRPRVTPVRGFRPGSVARTPGFVIREDEERYLLLVGSAYGEYLWTVVADAAGHLGGGPIGVDDLQELPDA
jgi:glycine cleavage system aminomethyltransferase T